MKKRNLMIVCVPVLCACIAAGVFQHFYAEKETAVPSSSETAVLHTEQAETETIESSIPASDEQADSSSKSSAKQPDNRAQHTDLPESKPNSGTTAERQQAASGQREEPAKTEPGTVTVTFSISCKNALNYGADVPSSGYILSPVSYTAEEGETVFDALKTLCKDNGISLKYQDIYYIQGIGGLNEKDCGGQSGWMYRVNGTAPNKSACKYTLSDGDRVEWYYVTSPGDR